MTAAQFLLFLSASVILIITPGQDLIFIVTRSIAHGPRAAIVSAAGVASGLVFHSACVAVGLAALVQASDTAFFLIKLLGASYLIWIGIGMIRHQTNEFIVSENLVSARRLYLDAALSNISNPKIFVFYVAFLPQFVSASDLSPGLSLFCLGVLFAVLTFLIKGSIGLVAAMSSTWLSLRNDVMRRMRRFSGVALIALGLSLMFEGRR